jgi:AAA domain
VSAEDYDRAAADAEERWREQGLGELVVTTMSDVAPEEVQWLWGGRIPLGKLTVLEGDPKGGKSTLTLDLIARVSKAGLMPDGSPSDLDGPAHCLLMTAEDGLADTVRPRLDLAGAESSRVVVWEAVLSARDDRTELRMPSLPLDVVRLEALVTELSAKLVVVDVLAAYLGERVDSHHDADVRRALAPLAKMAERTGAAVVVLRHLNKAGGTKAMYRGGGSIGISGQARSILLAGLDPGDETKQRRVLAVTACNLAATAPSLSYELVAESPRAPVRIAWTGSSNLSADELLVDPGTEDERSERKEITALLTSWTKDGPVAVDEVRRRMRALGLSPSDSTLQRARRQAGVKVGAPSGFGGKRHYWRPAQSGQPTCPSESDRTKEGPFTRDDDVASGPVRSHIYETGLDSEDPAERWYGDTEGES